MSDCESIASGRAAPLAVAKRLNPRGSALIEYASAGLTWLLSGSSVGTEEGRQTPLLDLGPSPPQINTPPGTGPGSPRGRRFSSKSPLRADNRRSRQTPRLDGQDLLRI